jgi:alcohol dehydrogenase
MRALVYTGKLSLEMRDEPKPVASPKLSLVKVEAAGICGSDMHAYHGHDARRVPPMILGHELSGTVVEGDMAGQRVAVNPMITCNQCRECRHGNPNRCQSRDLIGLGRAGGFADYIAISANNLFPLEDSISATHASLMEPTAVSLHAVVMAERALTRPISESRTLIIGGGAIGLLAALVLKQKGVRSLSVAETNGPRRETLESLQCGSIYDPLTNDTTPDDRFDLVVDAVGSGRTRAYASQKVRAGGVISHIGLQDNEAGLDTRKLTLQEITFIGHYTYNQTDLKAALNLLSSGALGSLDWVESRPLEEGAAAFKDIHTGATAAPKIVLHPAHS